MIRGVHYSPGADCDPSISLLLSSYLSKNERDGEANALRLANYGLLLGVGVRGLGDA